MRNTVWSRSAVVGAAVLVAPALAQEPFQWEIGGAFSQSEFSRTDNQVFDPAFGFGTFLFTESTVDTDRFRLDATWFFEPVESNRGPLERAAFLDRASSISAFALRSELTASAIQLSDALPSFSEQAELAENSLGFGFRYVLPDDTWFIEASVSRRDTESIPGNASDQYAIAAGRYLGDRTAVSLRIDRSEGGSGSILPGTSGGQDNYSLEITHIGDLWGDWQYAVDSSLTESDQDFVDLRFDVSGTLYPSRYLGFGAQASVSAEDFTDQSKRYGAFGRWFVNDAWSVSARYEWTDFEGSFGDGVDIDDDAFELRVDHRF